MFVPRTLDPMQKALSLARRAQEKGEVPVGAVLMVNQGIIAQAHNLGEHLDLPLAHAEMLCLIQAYKKGWGPRLHQARLYVTLEPCPMCRHALYLAKVDQVYFGAYATNTTQSLQKSPGEGYWIGGIDETRCGHLLLEFFQNLRTEP